MTIDGKLRSALFWMVGIGIQVYCIAESNIALSLVATPIWLLAWPLSMSKRGRSIPKLVLGLIALGLTIRVLASALVTPEDFVASVSRYIVWLQLLKLYDERAPTDVAQAMALSVFLVLGSCLTSNSMWLGVGLLIYTPAALWGITIYQLYAETRRTDTGDGVGAGDIAQNGVGDGAGNGVIRPISNKAISHLRRLGVVAGLATAGVAVVVFMFMPRGYGEGFLGDVGMVDPVAVSGVPDEVRLGESGFITTSMIEVLEVRITDAQGQNVGALIKPVYLKALTLDEYAGGRWRQSRQLANRRSSRSVQADRRPLVFRGVDDEASEIPGLPVYAQHVVFLAGDRSRLPAMNRVIRMEPDSAEERWIRLNAHDITLFNSANSPVSAYTVWSQPDAPRIPPVDSADPPRWTLDWRYPRLFVGSRAEAVAIAWIEEAGLTRDPEVHIGPDDHQIASLFAARLASEYEYTLEMIAPEPGEDPIDMFLDRTRAGHCEYFAGAMAAMLRSLGIDSRVVTGYAATEFDEEAGVFIVRENQAHAWVEARTEPNRWRTYDPSPGAEVATAHQASGGVAGFARRVLKAANAFWIDHIVGFDRARQEQALGNQTSRIRAFFERLWPSTVTSDESDEQLLEFRASSIQTLIAAIIQIAGLVIGAFGISVALIILMRRLDAYLERRDRHRERIGNDPEHALRERQSAFFRRYQKSLRSARLARPVSTPPMTHALSLTDRGGALASDSAQLTALYYRLRFGHELLSPDELDEADRILLRITSALGRAR